MIVRDYYDIGIPGDAFDDENGIIDAAIHEARERARLYCLPAEWTGRIVTGEIGDWEVTVRVRRRRNRIGKNC